MDYNKYFAQAEEEANESYLNYGGYPSTDADLTTMWRPQVVHKC